MNYRYYRGGTLVESNDPIDFEIDDKTVNNRRTIVLTAKKDNLLLESVYEPVKLTNPKAKEVFFNGYQSWTDSKEIKLNAKEKNIKHSPQPVVKAFAMDKYGDSTFYQYKRHLLHGYDICYSKSEKGFFYFSLNFIFNFFSSFSLIFKFFTILSNLLLNDKSKYF